MAEHQILVVGKPYAMTRPRVTRKGHTYTPKRVREAKQRIAEAWDGPTFTGPVSVEVYVNSDATVVDVSDVGWDSKLTGDVDNYAKLVLDALNGVAFDDDKQVMELLGVKR